MTTLGAGTYNTVLGENRDAANDALFASQKHLDDYHLEQKQQQQIEQGENQKTGAMDAAAATGGVGNAARFAVRKMKTGKTYAQMAMEDFRNLKGKTPSAPAESFNSIATSEGSVDKATGELTTGGEGGVELNESSATEGPAATGTEGASEGAADAAETATEGAGEGAGEAAGETAAKEGGELVSKAGGAAAESMAKTIAAKSAFWGGKALGNVGGAIDLVKDISAAAQGKNFFSGDGSSTLDEVGNGLTLAGSALDIVGIALPFLEPIGLALTAAGAVSETAGSLTDQADQEKKNKQDFDNNQPAAPAPKGAAGLGFVASAPTNPMKMITGSSSF